MTREQREQQLKRLFQQYTPEENESQRRYDQGRINELHGGFCAAAINTAVKIPADREDERERFIKHAWKAYAIAMSAHNAHVIPPSEIAGIGEYVLSKLYQSARDSCEKTPNNHEQNNSDS